jgi:hypothetical protein
VRLSANHFSTPYTRQYLIERLLVLQPVSSVTNKSVIPEVFYRESIAEYGFPIKDFGNDERLVGYELTGCNTSYMTIIETQSSDKKSTVIKPHL